ncbi:MAG TPA: indolepyruvate oxidoreductase subunit beta family protein [Methylomirabilota bacterium]|nr:indolepyruvate oxidoreductase subunit beta family protein [Methylomirabilota bacterium]
MSEPVRSPALSAQPCDTPREWGGLEGVPAPSSANAEPRLFSLLIPAVGGQGGGVLAEWIVEAALHDGLTAHSTSIPGVAQRTGSTTYYVEVFSGPGEGAPAFSLYPVPGALDVLLAPEFLEVGRAIENGVPSSTRTTIIASTHRLYSIHEKVATSGAIYPGGQLEGAARAFARTLIAFDALALARQHDSEVNAVLLGALAATGALPIRAEAYRAAIAGRGVGVDANLRGFQAGHASSRVGAALPRVAARRALRPAPAPVLADALAGVPCGLRPLVGEALARLVDYQDERYAARYLERLAPFATPGGDPEVARLVAKHLAVWMTYEDAIRVADLKTRAGRFARIREEVGAREAEVIVTDYLRPDLDEIYGILPDRLVAPIARWAERRWPHGRPALGQHVRTTTVLGFLRLWLLARCRWLRPHSYRARREHERMERWLAAIRSAQDRDPALAREVAAAAQLVKGYGEVRRRMMAHLDRLLESVMTAAASEAGGDGFPVATGLAGAFRRLVLTDPEGEQRAVGLAAEVLARLEQKDREAALAALSAA